MDHPLIKTDQSSQTDQSPYDADFFKQLAREWWRSLGKPAKAAAICFFSIVGMGCLFLYSIAC